MILCSIFYKFICYSVGPSVLEVFNTLLKHLKISTEHDDTSDGDRKVNVALILNTHVYQSPISRKIQPF